MCHSQCLAAHHRAVPHPQRPTCISCAEAALPRAAPRAWSTPRSARKQPRGEPSMTSWSTLEQQQAGQYAREGWLLGIKVAGGAGGGALRLKRGRT